MFASVWQLLTAIFFFSALTKLVYKLIKQEDSRGPQSRRLLRRGAHHEQLNGHFGEQRRAQLRRFAERPPPGGLGADASQQQQQQQGQGPVEADAWQLGPDEEEEQQQQQHEHEHPQQQQQHEELDEDDEFEEALSQVFGSNASGTGLSFGSSASTAGSASSSFYSFYSSPLELEREQEERRLRWLSRQQFRRQLNRLSGSAASIVRASAGDASDCSSQNSADFQDAASSCSWWSVSQQQQQLGGSHEQAERQQVAGGLPAYAVQLSGNHEPERAKQQISWPCGSAASAARSGALLSGDQKSFAGARPLERDPLSGPVFDASQEHQRPRQQQQQQQQQQQGCYEPTQLSNLGQLIAEVFLLEPLKLTCSIVRHTFKTFCAFLDFIEGIEPPLAEEQGREQPRPAGFARTSQRGATQADSAGGGASRGNLFFQTNAANNKRRSNYFHRRYLSRRSLSAALLSDDDENDDENNNNSSSSNFHEDEERSSLAGAYRANFYSAAASFGVPRARPLV